MDNFNRDVTRYLESLDSLFLTLRTHPYVEAVKQGSAFDDIAQRRSAEEFCALLARNKPVTSTEKIIEATVRWFARHNRGAYIQLMRSHRCYACTSLLVNPQMIAIGLELDRYLSINIDTNGEYYIQGYSPQVSRRGRRKATQQDSSSIKQDTCSIRQSGKPGGDHNPARQNNRTRKNGAGFDGNVPPTHQKKRDYVTPLATSICQELLKQSASMRSGNGPSAEYSESQPSAEYSEGQPSAGYPEGQYPEGQYPEGQYSEGQYSEGQPPAGYLVGQSSLGYPEGQPPAGYLVGQSSIGYLNYQPTTGGYLVSQPSTGYLNYQPTTGYLIGHYPTEYSDGQPAAEHREGQPAAEHREGQPEAEHLGGQPAVEHRESQPAAEYQEGQPAAEHLEGQQPIANTKIYRRGNEAEKQPYDEPNILDGMRVNSWADTC